MGLEPSQQREVWQEAVETAPNGKLKSAGIYMPQKPFPEFVAPMTAFYQRAI